MQQRQREDYNLFKQWYDAGNLRELTATSDGLFWLTLRSLARKEALHTLCTRAGVDGTSLPAADLMPTLYLSTLTIETLHQTIRELYASERAVRRANEEDLQAELFKLRVFDWGGIYQNDINRYLVDNYIKRVTHYDELVRKIETEALRSLSGFVLCSWYNHWTSILIEDIFKDHARVLPTVGKIKQVDFFVDGLPFDLKVTYFPADYLRERRTQRGLVAQELAELKAKCREFHIPFDRQRPEPELKIDLLTALAEHSEPAVQTYYQDFVATRKAIIAETIAQPRPLLQWLYERQGAQRFDASNRLFLILINQENLEESWKLKRDFPLLQSEINTYLDTRSFAPNDLLIDWSYNDMDYQSYTDALFIIK